eukprot:13889751-Alexandrium_andersonii.AAC.1
MFLLSGFPQVGTVLGWAEKQLEPIPGRGHPAVVCLTPGVRAQPAKRGVVRCDPSTISDRLAMTKPELAGAGH